MSLANLKTLARKFARVDSSIVSQTDGSSLDSDESVAIVDAVSEHSKRYPRILTAEISAPASYDVALATAISGWGPEYSIDSIRYPLATQDWEEVEKQDWMVFKNASGAWTLRFLIAIPASSYWITYTMPHTLTASVDTLSDERPGEVEAVAHLAAANILRMAANYGTRQFNSSLLADSADAPQQGINYSARSADERKEYERRIKGTGDSGNGTVDWGYPAPGNTELFWRTRRYR